MEMIIRKLDQSLICTDFKFYNKINLYAIYVQSSHKVVACPYCGIESKKTHSYYKREIQELPI